MATLEQFRLSAQEMYWRWLKRSENLRRGNVKIIQTSDERNKYNLGAEQVGQTVSSGKLEKIFGERGRILIQTFARDLLKSSWYKFAVSQAKFQFTKDPNMMFFEIGKPKKKEEDIEIVYLGTGCTDKIPEIVNEIAADSWGFAVLRLEKEE